MTGSRRKRGWARARPVVAEKADTAGTAGKVEAGKVAVGWGVATAVGKRVEAGLGTVRLEVAAA